MSDSRPTLKQVEALSRQWQPSLGLESWYFIFRVETLSSEQHYMEIMRSENYERAIISIAPAMLKGGPDTSDFYEPITPAFVERCLVHELVHCVIRDMRFVPFDLLEGELNPALEHAFEKVLKSTEERVVDKLASALCNSISYLKEPHD